ncbi:MAG: hypothetical protein ACPGO3_14770 [Magnetospiraceae bacterium]
MRFFLALLAGIGGAIGGYIGTAFLAFLVLDAGAPGDSGGTAMGVFFGLAPWGGVAGLILCMFLVLRRKPVPADPTKPETEPVGEGANPQPSAAAAQDANTRPDFQAIGAVGVILVLLLGGYFALFYEYTPPSFSPGERPLLMFEVKIPTAAIKEDDYFTARTELRTWQHVLPPEGQVIRRIEGDNTIFAGAMHLYNRVDDRKFWVYPSIRHFVEFNLYIPASPLPTPDFGPWWSAALVEIHGRDGDTYPLDAKATFIRTRIVGP